MSPKLSWPPLIEAQNVPRFVRVRDFVLTSLMWLLLLYALRNLFLYLYDFLSPPVFTFTLTSGPDWAAIWRHLESFVYLALFLVAWLLFWSVVRRRDLRRGRDHRQPEPVSLAELAEPRHLDPERLARFQNEKVVVIQYDADHRIVSVTAGSEGVPPPSS